jgi:hypothetical protein
MRDERRGHVECVSAGSHSKIGLYFHIEHGAIVLNMGSLQSVAIAILPPTRLMASNRGRIAALAPDYPH